jgi:hypothetical protein
MLGKTVIYTSDSRLSLYSLNMGDTNKSSRDSIRCPACGELIPITETLHHQLTEEARVELRREIAAQQKAQQAKEVELQAREEKLQEAEQSIEQQVKKRLEIEKASVARKALEKAREEVSLEVRDLRTDAADKSQKLEEAQQNELKLRKEKRDLEAAKKTFELDAARKLDAERERIRSEVGDAFLEEHRLKNAEKDHKLQEALRINQDLQRKLQQGSQQTQGEVLEEELEEILKSHFPFDQILPVAKGVRGADVLQRVNARSGIYCGAMIWETKHAKNWSDAWIEKLKSDQREAKADIAIIVTDALPRDVTTFGYRDGVWICACRLAVGIAIALRYALIEVARAKTATAAKNEVIETLFKYLTGPEFRHRVEAIVSGFISMKEDLDEEKRIATRRWARREKQLDSIITNTSGMYGDLQGLIGTSLQPIAALESGHDNRGGKEVVDYEDVEISDEDIPF